MSFEACIRAAKKDGAISSDEADDLIRRYNDHVGAMDGDRVAAKARLADELSAEGLERRRRDLLSVQAMDKLKKDVTSFRTASGKKDLAAGSYNVMEHYGFAGFSSVKGKIQALIGAAHAEMESFLHEFRRSLLSGQRFNKPSMTEVEKAAFGETASPEAKALYRGWLGPAEKLRTMFNEAGGAIGWRDDYGLPTSHNSGAVQRAGFQSWKNFVNERLAWERMQHPVTKTPILPEERDAVLRHVWESIVMDGWNTREPSAAGFGRPSLANSRADPRFLTFKSADAWREYNIAFGKGDTFAAMMDHTHSLARDVAMMQRLGPNPAATISWLKQLIESEGAKVKAELPNMMRDGMKPTAADRAVYRAKATLDGYYEQMRGSGTPDTPLSLLGSTLRNVQYADLLGSAVVTHVVQNPIIQAFSRKLHGLPIMHMIPAIIKAFGEPSARQLTRAGLVMDDALHTLGSVARESGTLARVAEGSKWLPDRTVAWTGLKPVVEAMKRSFMQDMMGHMADHVHLEFPALPDRLRRLLSGYGLNAPEWEVMRQADIYEPEKDAPFLRWREIRDAGLDPAKADAIGKALGLGDMAPAERAAHIAGATHDTAMKYLELLHQEVERAVPSSTWRTRAMMLGTTKAGSYQGELFRSAAMFHGFIASFMMNQISAIAHEAAAGKSRGASYAGGLFILMTLGGMATFQMKQVINGKDPMSMDPLTKHGLDAWASAMLTSGGMGLFGDFLASDLSSYGHGPLETLAGPLAGLATDAVTGAVSASKSLAHGKAPAFGEGAVRLLRNNMPFATTAWQVRAAWNRVVMDQLQYLADPKAHTKMRQMERNLSRNTGQGYWWEPGEVAPSRFPKFTQGRP